MSHVFNHTFTISGDAIMELIIRMHVAVQTKFWIVPVFRVSQQVVYLALSVVLQDALGKGESMRS